MATLLRVVLAFTIGETSPRYWLVMIGALLAFAVPAIILSANGLSAPSALTIPYSLLIVALSGARAAPANRGLRLQIAGSIVSMPLIFMIGWFGELWQVTALLVCSIAAFGAGLAFGSRNTGAYLSGEVDSD